MEPPYLGAYQIPQVLFARECLQASLYDSVELLQAFNLFCRSLKLSEPAKDKGLDRKMGKIPSRKPTKGTAQKLGFDPLGILQKEYFNNYICKSYIQPFNPKQRRGEKEKIEKEEFKGKEGKK
ncbi:hypothetical protein Fmac_015060 [Flemingia macrophylla]|uniref:Uncharacterized protein n=1 Tax=Flemingia macrophylla TaxID=520843 RepID=A0ABD1MDK8_9FABA